MTIHQNRLLIKILRIELKAILRSYGKHPSTSESIDLYRRRQRLQIRIDDFQTNSAIVWPGMTLPTTKPSCSLAEGPPEDSFGSDDEDLLSVPLLPSDPGAPEAISLLLPSAIGIESCTEIGIGYAAEAERKLWLGVANDSLQNIRVAIARKAIIFREGLRHSKTKKKKTRSWDQIHAVEGSMTQNVRVYQRAREAILLLGSSEQEMARYQQLKKEDLNVNTARMDPSLRGQRDKHLSWIWSMDTPADAEEPGGMVECEPTLPR